VKSIERPSEEEVKKKQVFLPPSKMKKVIIFDMDETLIHCVDDMEQENPDIVLKINFPNGEVVEAGINVRPYAIECLREASKKY
jgi:CTD small phosphatase-like protein 2